MTDLPEGWVETTLGELATINPKESIRKEAMAKCVAMEKLPTFDKRITGFEVKPFKGGMKFRNGDALLARITPCLENGKTAYVDILDEGEVGFGSTEYIVIREKDRLSDKQFLFYLATSPRFRKIAIKCMTGTSGRQRVQTDVLINKNIFIPPLPEQKAIAAMLSSLDDKIELLREQNKTLETLAQTIFKEWFVNFNYPDATGEMVDSELGEIPKGWRVGKLGDEFDIIMGQSPKGSSYNETGDGMVFYQGRAEFQSRFPQRRLYTTEPKRLAEKHDVLMSVRAPVGDINVASEKCCIGRGLAAIHSEKKAYALYKMMSLSSHFDLFESEGTVFGSINKKSLESIEVVIPDTKVIDAFETVAWQVDEKVFNNTCQIQELSKTRDVLLPTLMSGQVRMT